MPHALMLIPVMPDVGLTSVAAGLYRAIESQGILVSFFKPVAQRDLAPGQVEHSTGLIPSTSRSDLPQPIPYAEVNQRLSNNQWDILLEDIIAHYTAWSAGADIVVIEGLITSRNQQYATDLNRRIAKALDAELILVASPGENTADILANQIEIAISDCGGYHNKNLRGCILNKVGAPLDQHGHLLPPLTALPNERQTHSFEDFGQRPLFNRSPFKLLASIPWQQDIMAPRVLDIAHFFNADIIHAGEISERRVQQVKLCARSLSHMLHVLQPGTLIITSGDRADIIMATCMAALSGVKIAALLLTGGFTPESDLMQLCAQAIATGLPILSVPLDSYLTALKVPEFDLKVPLDDTQRIELIKDFTARHITTDWIKTLSQQHAQRRLSPPAFRYQLVEKARQKPQRIVLPEGNEPRTIEAASICAERHIAQCILLGDSEEIQRIAQQIGVTLATNIQIIDPATLRDQYRDPLVKLREHKGVTPVVAEEQLQDNVMLGTMMLQCGEVDGLVSGAVHTTANTIRPALQIIKTAPEAQIVSSIFFMCLPDQVLVYGDCAVNPDPNAEQLADIAIQSADSAQAFGITPRVAMISYSTGQSGGGSDVEKVRAATQLVKQKRPDIIIDGPLQYDAASIENVAHSKAPQSPVAGRATVFIFPDLNTGNTTYKAVQRSANVVCIGPMLQGLRKPVNDLSRGALVDDIVFTIALTAIQAQSR